MLGAPNSGPGWMVLKAEDGVAEVQCQHWMGFVHFVNQHLTMIKPNIFRGQARSSWNLLPTLDRETAKLDVERLSDVKGFMAFAILRKKHLNNFKYAARGRRGMAPPDLDDDGWWALGQHYGLATPLLDWSESPYVAAYFAFCEGSHPNKDNASIYCLNTAVLDARIEELKKELEEQFDPGDVVRLVRPLADDNARLINQRGMFTIGTPNECLSAWVRKYFRGRKECPLVELRIPRSERAVVLRHLNSMNVNHLTLFPELSGATGFCNLQLVDHLY